MRTRPTLPLTAASDRLFTAHRERRYRRTMHPNVRRIELSLQSWRFELDVAGEPEWPLVLLLHGYPQSSYAYRDTLPILAAAGLYAVAPNQRGYSPRARPSQVQDYATRHLLDDVLAMARACGAERFHLVGHDWGGQLAWLFAAQHPEALHSLSVLSRPHPAAFAEALREDSAQSERSRHHRDFDDPSMATRLLADDARRMRRPLLAQGVPEAACDQYVNRLSEPAALDAALHWYRAARSGGSSRASELPSITVPTLYVWGEEDATVGRHAAENTARYVDAPYRFEVIEGAGHYLTDQVPERVNALLREHILMHRPP